MFKEFFSEGEEPGGEKAKHESIGIEMRKKAIETLKSARNNPDSKKAKDIERAHALITLLKERRGTEGADVSEELAGADVWEKSLKGEAGNDTYFGSEDKRVA